MLSKINKFVQNKYTKISLLIFCLLFTFILRSVHSDRMPGYGHLEEQMFSWAGLNLIEDGVPVSWSTLDYPDENRVHWGDITDKYSHAKHSDVKLYKPWLDQPPLFSLIIGSSAHYFGAEKEYLTPSAFMRFPMIFIGLLTSISLFFFTRKLFGYWIALSTILLWGTIPLFVFSSRMAVPENAIAFFYITSLYFFLKYIEKPNKLLLLALMIIPGIAGLMKPTGYFIAPLIAFMFFIQRRWLNGGVILGGLIPFILIFLAYGYYFGGDVFNTILQIQGGRPAGWNALTYLISNPAFDISPFYDSWYVLAWVFALFFVLIQAKEKFIQKMDIRSLTNQNVLFICWAFLYWVLIAVFSGGEQDLLPWYRIPFFPLLPIFLTLGLKYLYHNPNFFTLALAALFLIGNRIHLVNAFHPNVTSSVFRLEFILLVLPGLLLAIWDKKILIKLAKASIILMIVWGVLINVLVVKDYYARVCEAQTCPIGPSTFLTR